MKWRGMVADAVPRFHAAGGAGDVFVCRRVARASAETEKNFVASSVTLHLDMQPRAGRGRCEGRRY
jgi:hypothetical protein